MIRHAALFGWNEHAEDADKTRAFDELGTLPDIVPSVRAFAMGADVRVNEGNYDFAVTLDESVTSPTYNYTDADEIRGMGFEPAGEFPGRSSFLRTADGIFHTYSVCARGAESIGGSYYLLDETVLGRQEEWEQPKGRVQSARAARPDFAS